MCNSLVSKVIPEVSIGVFYIVDVPATREAEPPCRSASRNAYVFAPAGKNPVPVYPHLPLAIVSVQTWFSLLSLFGFVFFFFLLELYSVEKEIKCKCQVFI